MAKDSSFDVVSEVNMQEVDNAFQQATREISQRYDLKDSGATIELSKGDKLFTINAPADFVSKQIVDVLSSKLIKRGIDLKAVSWDAPQAASGGTVRVLGHIVEGIDRATAKKINKDIKDQKLKVKVTIETDKLRVSSASKDALQTVIQFLRDQTTASRCSSPTTANINRKDRSPTWIHRWAPCSTSPSGALRTRLTPTACVLF